MFWVAVQEAFAASPESDELRAERALWNSTIRDGLGLQSTPEPSEPRQ
jgi:hypothetical protein